MYTLEHIFQNKKNFDYIKSYGRATEWRIHDVFNEQVSS